MDTFPAWLVPSSGAAPWLLTVLGILAIAWKPVQVWAAGASLALEQKKAEWEKRKAEAGKSKTPPRGLPLAPPCPNVPHPPDAVAAAVVRALAPYFGQTPPEKFARAVAVFVGQLADAEASEAEERLAKRTAEIVASRITGDFAVQHTPTTGPKLRLPK